MNIRAAGLIEHSIANAMEMKLTFFTMQTTNTYPVKMLIIYCLTLLMKTVIFQFYA